MLKVCVVTTSLASGGAERSAALLSRMLFNLGYNVHVLATKNQIQYTYSGQLFTLEKEVKGSKSNFLKTKTLKTYFNKHTFDYVIDNRVYDGFFKEFLLYRYVFKGAKLIKVAHNFNIVKYFPKAKIQAYLIFGGVDKIVAVSNEIKEEVQEKYGFKNVVRIYNPIEEPKIKAGYETVSQPKDDYILFFGRIEDHHKNLSLLIKSYKESKLPQQNIKLLILGSGTDLGEIKDKVKAIGMEGYVVFLPYTPKPFLYVQAALFTVLTSRYEGLPMTVIESLALGTPVVAVDCKSGPKELITNGYNGLLVKNHDISAFAEAMDTFVENTKLYAYCKKNAKQSVEHLSIEKIALHWQGILLDDEKS